MDKGCSPKLSEKGLCSPLGSFDGLVDPPLGEGLAVAVVDRAAVLIYLLSPGRTVGCCSAPRVLQANLAIGRRMCSPQSPERKSNAIAGAIVEEECPGLRRKTSAPGIILFSASSVRCSSVVTFVSSSLKTDTTRA